MVAAAPFGKEFERAVGAAIVYQDNFARIRRRIDEARDLGTKQGKALFLVVTGNNERQESRVRPGLQIAGRHSQRLAKSGAIDLDGIACGRSVATARGYLAAEATP